MSNQTSSHTSKRSRNSTPLTRRTWTAAEERTLIDGLKELCINGWRSDNGTFRSGYLKELECYLRKHHPNSGLKGEPHVLSKTRYWKKCYASIAMLKSRSGLGFQYSDGTIIVDDPKFWDDFLKTCNRKDFLKCSIVGLQYGTRASDVELAAAKQLAETWPSGNAEDSCLIKGCWMEEPNTNVILLFYRILTICYAAVLQQNEETRGLNYESESPHEVSFLVAAREFS
uniref:RNase H family protein n=1 Tax=Solanum tuberosum TaxID=4113 RepID=M1BH76_SOLTU